MPNMDTNTEYEHIRSYSSRTCEMDRKAHLAVESDILGAMRERLDTTRPTLSIPATKREVREAQELLQSEHLRLIEHLSDRRNVYKTIFQANDANREEFLQTFMPNEPPDSLVLLEIRRLTSHHKYGKDTVLFFEQAMDVAYSFELQKQLHVMMQGQTEEMKLWLLEMSGFSSHFTLTKPQVQLEKHPRRSHLPLEIIAMIYSFCDLESSVSLRQVNYSWYTAFKQLQHIWAAKLEERTHWCPVEEDYSE